MSTKSKLLGDILGNLNDEENNALEKVAADSMKTENKEASKKIPTDTPSSTEKKLGLGGLTGLQKETFHEVPTVTSKKDGGSTENVSGKPTKVEPGTMFEKKASADVLAELLKTAGLEDADLSKVASEEENDGLLKIAYDTIGDLNDLEKVADAMAERAASKVLAILSEKI